MLLGIAVVNLKSFKHCNPYLVHTFENFYTEIVRKIPCKENELSKPLDGEILHLKCILLVCFYNCNTKQNGWKTLISFNLVKGF